MFCFECCLLLMWFSAPLEKPVFHPEVIVNDKVLEVVDTQLYLGLMFDSKLSWKSQVSNVCKKMSYYTYLASNIFSVMS